MARLILNCDRFACFLIFALYAETWDFVIG
jgi:hypothetical protein